LFCLILGLVWPLAAQKESGSGNGKPLMQPKVYNFYSFTPDVKMDVSQDPTLFPDSLKNHPEFGILPYNTQCKNCYEEIGKRTAYSRHFVEPGTNGKHHYTQKSYFPLHYKNKDGFWVTLDHRMKEISQNTEVKTFGRNQLGQEELLFYFANGNGIMTGIANNTGRLIFNKHIEAFFVGDSTVQGLQLGSTKYDQCYYGDDGAICQDAWNGIDIQYIFKREGIKTNYVIRQKPIIPPNAKYLVFVDNLSLDTENKQLVYSNQGNFGPDSLYTGDVSVKMADGSELAIFNEPKYFDGYGYGMSGFYKIIPFKPFNHNPADPPLQKLQLYVPVSFLNDPNVRYPLYIDPLVEGKDSLGVFSAANPNNSLSANMAFSNTPQTCNYQLTVEVPGMSDIQDTYIDIEYENTFSATCGTPPLQPPFCQFADVRMEVRSVSCGTTTGQLTCNPASPPFIGTCTTDPNLVPGASALRYPNFLACVPPQCPNYFLDFELRNMEMQ